MVEVIRVKVEGLRSSLKVADFHSAAAS